MKLLNWCIKILDYVSNSLTFFGGLLLVFIMLLIVAEVFIRYVLNGAIIWSLEVVQFSLLWMAFLAAAWVLKRDAHVRIDTVLNLLKPKFQSLLNMVTYSLGVAACLLLTYYSLVVTIDYFQKGTFFQGAMEVPKFAILAITPVGFFLLSVEFMKKVHGFLSKYRSDTA
jgi:C4-dicarboxylate transporter, DctQ subunit